MMSWLVAFVLTMALETPVYAYWLEREAKRWWAPLAASLLLNLATHPLFSWWALHAWPSSGEVLLAECAIALAEGCALALLRRSRLLPNSNERGARLLLSSIGIAVLANGVSYGLGLLLFG
jgi:hypothetical protein